MNWPATTPAPTDPPIKRAITAAVREAMQLQRRTNRGDPIFTAVEYAEQLILPVVEAAIKEATDRARAEGYRAGVAGRAEPLS